MFMLNKISESESESDPWGTPLWLYFMSELYSLY